MPRRKTVAVVGSAECVASDECWQTAYRLGAQLVKDGCRVLTGGLGGVMEAALAGARSAENYREGDTIAVLPSFDASAANPYADIVIATGADVHMNGIVANADAVIAVGGGAGTLCEIAMALERRRPVLAFCGIDGSSRRAARFAVASGAPVEPLSSAEEVTEKLKKLWKDEGV